MADVLRGQVASAAVSAAGKKVANDIVGKQTGYGTAWSFPSKATQRTPIEWEHFNYPPVLRLIHFDMKELPKALQYTARYLNMVFLLTTCACVVNMVDTIIIVYWASQTNDLSTMVGIRMVTQSLLHLVLIPMAALLTFYVGYRGIASPDAVLVARFQIAQVLLGMLSISFALWPVGCINGIGRLLFLFPDADGFGLFIGIVSIVESSLWLLNFLLAVICLARVRRVNVYPEARSTGKYLET